MIRWLPWSPSAEPTREECGALIGRRVRVVRPLRREDWIMGVVIAVREIGRIEVVLDEGVLDAEHWPWLWPIVKHAPWVVVEIEAP